MTSRPASAEAAPPALTGALPGPGREEPGGDRGGGAGRCGQDAEPPAGAAQGGGDAAEGEGGAARPAHPPQGRRAAGGAERGGAGRPERGAGRVGGSGPGAGASSSSSSEREGIARGPGAASGLVGPSCSEGRSAASRPWLLPVPQADLVSVWQSRGNKGLSVPCPQVEELALQSMIRSREEDAAVPAAAAAESQEVRAALGPAVGAASWAPGSLVWWSGCAREVELLHACSWLERPSYKIRPVCYLPR